MALPSEKNLIPAVEAEVLSISAAVIERLLSAGTVMDLTLPARE